MITGLAIDSHIAGDLESTLMKARPLESGAFCLLTSFARGSATRLVLGPPITGIERWDEQGEIQLTPSGQMISAAVSAAESAKAGLAFVHSHPFGTNVPSLSHIDKRTSERLAGVFKDLLDGPFASLVVGPGGWGGVSSGRSGSIETLDRIWVAGRHLQVFAGEARDGGLNGATDLDDRQVRAVGKEVQATLRGTHVAVVGAGGIGSPVAETLVRMGIGQVLLVDPDVLDTPSNARRVFGVKRSDFRVRPAMYKSEVVAAALNELDLGGHVEAVVGDVRDEATAGRLLACDVIISGTDTHSSRAALTELCVRSALPLIDVGARVGVRSGSQLDSLIFERRIQVPSGPCLWCWKVLDSERIRLELLPVSERESLEREGYVAGGLADPVPSVAALTVTAAGAATSALLGLLSGAVQVGPLAVSVDTLTLDSFPLSRQERDPECICRRWRPWGSITA